MGKIFYPIFLLTICVSCAKTKKWKTYKYEDFNFTIELPYEPKLTVKEIPGDEFKYNTVVSKSPDSGINFTSYGVFYVDFKNSFNSKDSSSIREYFDIIDEKKGDLNPTRIVSQKEFLQFGYPAKELVREYGHGNQMEVSRFILVNDKSYQLIMLFPTVTKDNPEHSKFLKSFRLGTK